MLRLTRRRAKRWLMRSLACLQAFSLALAPCIAQANPLGGTVVGGNASINTSGSTLTVTQSSSRAVINWQGFSINAGEITRFVQPGADAAVLNRVIGTDPSALLGALQANGQVFLINPHGILVGPNATINVGALTLSTLNLDDKEFMLHRPGGELHFRGNSEAGVINYGSIRAVEGNIHLIGAHVANHGTLSAPNGTVGMAAGQDVRLVDSAHPQLVVRPTAKSLGGTGVHNTGTIDALRVQLLAAHGNVYALAINNEGTVRANTVVREGGRIMLRASGGTIRNSGDLIAKGEAGTGGEVTVDASGGGRVELAGNVDVSGSTGGRVDVRAGDVALTGTVDASSTGSGDGGSVVVKADGTADFAGTIHARGGPQGGDGGFVEVSGSQLLLSGHVFTNAPAGRTGTLLLDPGEFDINASGPAGANSIGADTLTGSGYLADNNVVIATDGASPGNGEIRVNAPVIWNTPTSLSLLAHGNVRAKASVQNGAGTAAGEGGDVNIVAGWDGTAFDFSQIIAAGAFGDTLYGGDVYIGDGTQTSGIAVGSRFGATNVAAHDVNVLASTTTAEAFAQLGFRTDHTQAGYLIDSPITLHLTGDLVATAGAESAYAQLGHGGGFFATSGSSAGGSHNGDIEIAASGNLTFTGGGGEGAYAQLGHGGYKARGNHSGAVTITQAHDLRFTGGSGRSAYVQLAHGGWYAYGDHSGVLTITQVHDVTFNGGSSLYAYAQLGHGGYNADGDHSGALTITQARDVTFTAGRDSGAYVQLGHGGDKGMGSHTGAVTIGQANDLTFTAGDKTNAYAQLGHGGYKAYGDHTGALTITQANGLTFIAGSGFAAYAQLGHGGYGARGDHSGAVTITKVSDLMFTGGGHYYAYAQLGHGGYHADGSHSGTLMIAQAHDLTFKGSDAYAQLGHGGVYVDGNHSGAVTITQANNLTLTGGSDDHTYAQLGHGDASGNAGGTRQGDIDVRLAGEMSLVDGTGADSPWLIGHATTTAGGISNANVTLITGTLDYSNTATSTLATLNQDFADKMVANLAGGHVTIGATNGTSGPTGGMLVTGTFDYGRSGTPSATIGAHNLSFLSTSDIRFAAGVQNAFGTAAGDGGQVNVVAGWDGTTGVASPLNMNLIFANPLSYGNSSGSVYIGDGTQTSGIAVGSRFGPTNVVGHHVNVLGSTATAEAFAQLGFRTDHTQLTYVIDGPITVHLTGNLIATSGVDNAYAQVGHGGGLFAGYDPAIGAYRGAIEIATPGDLTFTCGSGDRAYAQLGHGGYYAYGNHSGSVTITQANDLTFTASSGNQAYAQLGHGGRNAGGDHNGNVTITQAHDLSFAAGSGFRAYAQLGHGDASSNADGTRQGDVFVRALGSVTLLGTASGPALIGHATTTAGGITGNVVVAVDQANPLVDDGGRLVMNRFSAIDMGGAPNQVRIFDTRRDGPWPHLIDDGAVINGVVFHAGGTPGTINGTWTPNEEFVTWQHEQWGLGATPHYTLADLGSPGLPYHGPFTFYFVSHPTPTPELRYQVFLTIAEMFDRFSSFPPWPPGPYTASYGAPGEAPPGTMLWLTSAHVFGTFADAKEEPKTD